MYVNVCSHIFITYGVSVLRKAEWRSLPSPDVEVREIYFPWKDYNFSPVLENWCPASFIDNLCHGNFYTKSQ